MDRPSSLPQVVPATPKRRGPSRGRHLSPISATDLLSTSTRWICQLSGAGLSPAHPPLPALPADPRPRASRHDRAVHGDVGQPQAASPTPSGDAVGAASPVVPVLPSLPEGCPEHRARAGPTRVCSTSREPRGAETDAPCHARFPRRLSPSRSSGAEDLSGGLRQVRRLPDPERLLPTSPSRRPPPLARAQSVRRPPLVLRLGRLSPASDTLSRVGTR